jgi:hypothetical protein
LQIVQAAGEAASNSISRGACLYATLLEMDGAIKSGGASTSDGPKPPPAPLQVVDTVMSNIGVVLQTSMTDKTLFVYNVIKEGEPLPVSNSYKG